MSKTKPIILVDVDEVFAELQGIVLFALAWMRGEEVIPNFENWDFFSIMSQEEKKEIRKIMESQGFCYNLPFVRGAKEAVEELREMGQVLAVTSPLMAPYWGVERTFWLKDKLGFQRDEIIQTSGKQWVPGDIFIDDKLENLEKWKTHWPDGLTVLWRLPNTSHLTFDGPSVRSWDECLKVIKSHLNQ